MPKNKTAVDKKISKKKAIINKIKPLITAALEGMEKKTGEKKFENGVSKAAKLLATKLKLTPVDKKEKEKNKEKKPAKKASKKEIMTNPYSEGGISKNSKKENPEIIKKKNISKKQEKEINGKL